MSRVKMPQVALPCVCTVSITCTAVSLSIWKKVWRTSTTNSMGVKSSLCNTTLYIGGRANSGSALCTARSPSSSVPGGRVMPHHSSGCHIAKYDSFDGPACRAGQIDSDAFGPAGFIISLNAREWPNAKAPARLRAGAVALAVPERQRCRSALGGSALGNQGQGGVEGLTRTHHRLGQLAVRVVVALDVDGPTLHRVELLDDHLLLGLELSGQLGEERLELGVLVLSGQGLGPVHGQVEVAATVVQLTHLAGRRLVAVQELAVGLVQGLGQHQGTAVVEGLAQMLQGGGQGQELAQGVPAQVVLLQQH